LGHNPGLNFIYVHLNRMIKEQDLEIIYIAGPGHGGPGLVANTYLEGTYSEVYPTSRRMRKGWASFQAILLSRRHSSHVAPETPGSIHEGGELGYSLTHAYGAVFDNPKSDRRLPLSVMARPKPDRWPQAGIPTNFSILSAMAPCCPSSTSRL